MNGNAEVRFAFQKLGTFKNCEKHKQLFNEALKSQKILSVYEQNKEMCEIIEKESGVTVNGIFDVLIVYDALNVNVRLIKIEENCISRLTQEMNAFFRKFTISLFQSGRKGFFLNHYRRSPTDSTDYGPGQMR